MLVSEYVTIPLRGMNVKRYEDMGYIIPRRIDNQGRNPSNSKASLLVKVDDLSRGSEVRIDVMCDYCGEIKDMKYCNYVIQLEKDIVNKDSCIACRKKKTIESNLIQYSVENPMQLSKIREKQNDSNRASLDVVHSNFIQMGFIPLFDTYTNDRERLLCKCIKHPDILQEKTHSSIKAGEGCNYCFYEGNRGENHHNWKGGITGLIAYIHNSKSIKMWKRDSLEYRGYKCMKTRSRDNLVVHHAKRGFSDILYEALDMLNMDIRPNVSEYTYEELHKIEMKCLQLHYWYGLGYTLTQSAHIEFHKMYGYKDFKYDDMDRFLYGYCDWDYENGSLMDY